MSGQSSILIVVMIVAVLAVLWASTTFNQFSIRNRITTSEAYNKFAKYLDIIKGFSRSSLQLATYKATYEVAQGGRTYYCNQPYTPSYKVILNDLEGVTKDAFNSYVDNLKFSEPLLKIDVKGSNCVGFDVTKDKLDSGALDEQFGISSYGSNVKISGGDNNVFSDNNIFSDILVRDRFMKLYRGFEKWYKTTKVFEQGCNSCATSGCGCVSTDCGACSSCPPLNSCITQNVIRKGVLELNNKIFLDESGQPDPFIECTGYTTTCHLDIRKVPCKAKGTCDQWEENMCKNCDTNRNDKLCVDDILKYGLVRAAEQKLVSYDCVVEMKDVKAAVNAVFTCTDKKYALPVPESSSSASSSTRYLKFVTKAYFSFQQEGVCQEKGNFNIPPPDACSCVPVFVVVAAGGAAGGGGGGGQPPPTPKAP